jgi:hypothetical protein
VASATFSVVGTLLNEFLKAHRKIEEQDTMIARQQKQIDALADGISSSQAPPNFCVRRHLTNEEAVAES